MSTIETRTVTETKCYILFLNPMRANVESRVPVAWSKDRNKLVDWYNSQLSDNPYVTTEGDKNWYKTFKKGSPIEWYNELDDIDLIDDFGHGIFEDWINLDIMNLNFLEINT